MEVYVIHKNYPSHDCWGRYESDWQRTDIIFGNEEAAKMYTNGNSELKYKAITVQ